MRVTVDTAERPSHKLSLIALSIASVFSNGVHATDEINMEKVQVFGQAVQIDKALNEQRNSNSIESVVHADGIGQLPDDNAAEALQRLPGVSVENAGHADRRHQSAGVLRAAGAPGSRPSQ